MGRFCTHPLVFLLNVPGTPNFAGTLLVTIQSDYKSFLTILDDFKISFIFVHSVHSMTQERSTTSQESLTCGFQPNISSGTIFRSLSTGFNLLIFRPQVDTIFGFIYWIVTRETFAVTKILLFSRKSTFSRDFKNKYLFRLKCYQKFSQAESVFMQPDVSPTISRHHL